MERCRQPFNVNTIAQEAGLAALDDTAFIRKAQKVVSAGKKYLYSELDRLKINYISSAANFILIDFKQDGIKIFNKLLKEGVIVRDMQQYNLKNFIRVTIGTEKENKKFIAALKKVLS
jgi:histidinol-phosphate aminotransferase